MRYDMKEMFQQKSFLASPEPAGAKKSFLALPEPAGAKKKFFSVARTRWSEKKVFLASPEPAEAKKKFFGVARIRWSEKKVFLSNRYMKTSLFYFVFNVAPTVFSQIVQHLAQYPF